MLASLGPPVSSAARISNLYGVLLYAGRCYWGNKYTYVLRYTSSCSHTPFIPGLAQLYIYVLANTIATSNFLCSVKVP